MPKYVTISSSAVALNAAPDMVRRKGPGKLRLELLGYCTNLTSDCGKAILRRAEKWFAAIRSKIGAIPKDGVPPLTFLALASSLAVPLLLNPTVKQRKHKLTL